MNKVSPMPIAQESDGTKTSDGKKENSNPAENQTPVAKPVYSHFAQLTQLL
jgi:hypothetical protein